MKLFSKTRQDNKIIISFCGIKIKYKIKIDDCFSDLFTAWQTDFNPVLLEEKLRPVLKSSAAQKEENKEVFLVFISTLIENNKSQEAQKYLLDYIQKFGLECVASYPLAANMACELGHFNENIKKVAHIWNILEQNRLNNSLNKFLKNKTIAIVGNSPNLIDKNKGKDIDAADVVVRFNNFRTQNFEKDYGSKTNLWVCCQAKDIVNRPPEELKKMDYILYNVDLVHTKLDSQCLEYIWLNLKTGLPISYIGADYKKDLKQYGIVYPSSGLSALFHLKNICSISRKNIFGFSFLENSSNYYDHYFQKRSDRVIKKFQKNGHHNFELENAVLQKLFKE